MKSFTSVFIISTLSFAAVSFAQTQPSSQDYVKFDDTRTTDWAPEFELVGIPSSVDNQVQKAYFYPTRSDSPQPLIISLYTWSGDYSQKDDLAPLCKQRDVNYIHPDFRGINKSNSACCSELALSDIDDAIAFARQHGRVDTSKIYVIGVSGGGYATLSSFMQSRQPVRKFSAWASISDLEAWYHESSIRKAKYAADILACTDSNDSLNIESAHRRSPLFMKTPVKKFTTSQLHIFAGIYDGIQGSVPITHSVNFYNKLLRDLSVKDKSKYVSDREKLDLLEHRRPLGNLGNIAERKICLVKDYGSLRLTIFEGNHEMLTEYALNELLKD